MFDTKTVSEVEYMVNNGTTRRNISEIYYIGPIKMTVRSNSQFISQLPEILCYVYLYVSGAAVTMTDDAGSSSCTPGRVFGRFIDIFLTLLLFFSYPL